MKSYFDLTGQVAVVTGCSTGLGVQMAHALANQGCKIVALARRQEKIDAVAKELHDTYGVETLAVRCDITDTQQVAAAVDTILGQFGRIDILVNNAGIGDCHKPTIKMDDDFWDRVQDVDLKGVMRCCRAALRYMVPANKGSIVNIASIGGVYCCAGAAYSAAKAGVLSLTKNLAIQYYGTGIRINSVSPGSTETPLFSPEKFEGVDEEMLALTARTHVRTIDHRLSPYEQAYTILFLASDEASGINGQDIVVDYGGRL